LINRRERVHGRRIEEQRKRVEERQPREVAVKNGSETDVEVRHARHDRETADMRGDRRYFRILAQSLSSAPGINVPMSSSVSGQGMGEQRPATVK